MKKVFAIVLVLASFSISSFAGIFAGAYSDAKVIVKVGSFPIRHLPKAARAVGKATKATAKALAKI